MRLVILSEDAEEKSEMMKGKVVYKKEQIDTWEFSRSKTEQLEYQGKK